MALSSTLVHVRERNSRLEEEFRKMERSKAEDDRTKEALQDIIKKQELQISELERLNALLSEQREEWQASCKRIEDRAASLLLQNEHLEIELKHAQHNSARPAATQTGDHLSAQGVSPKAEKEVPITAEAPNTMERESFLAVDSQNLELLNQERDKLTREKQPGTL